MRALHERDVLVQTDHGWTIRPGWDERELPPTIEGVLASRIDLLSREAAALLQTASVVGRRVQIPLLTAVVGDRPVDEPIEELVSSGFLERTSEGGVATVVFHHALVQDAAYSRLLRRQQRGLHLLVAEVAEDSLRLRRSRHRSPRAPPLPRRGRREGGRRISSVQASARDELFANDEAILHLRAREPSWLRTTTRSGLGSPTSSSSSAVTTRRWSCIDSRVSGRTTCAPGAVSRRRIVSAASTSRRSRPSTKPSRPTS